MRRKDREITEYDAIARIINDCYCCRLGLNDEGKVYIVPLSFGFEKKGTRCCFYFHGAKEGRKIELITRTHSAGFELDTNYQIHIAGTACGCSARFQSIIGTGTVTFVEDREEKIHALQCIMRHYTGKEQEDFPENALYATAVFKLEVEEMTCKEHP